MATLAKIIANVRSEVNDTATSHLIRDEIPKGEINGANVKFLLSYFPIVSKESMSVTVDGILVPQDDFLVDLEKGIIILSTPPTTSILVDYYFYVFNDNDITIWIYHGLKMCGFTESHLANLPETLEAAVEHLAIAMGCEAWARKWAEGFSWTIGPETVDKQKICENYLKLAEKNYKEGIEMRDDYYKRYGKRNAPVGELKQFTIRRYDVIR